MKVAISECTWDRAFQTLTVRGWTSEPAKVEKIRISDARGNQLGTAALDIERRDVAHKFPALTSATCGFEFRTEPVSLPEESVQVAYLGPLEEVLTQLSVAAKVSDTFSFERLNYDTHSRQLHFHGYYIPTLPIRLMQIHIGSERIYKINDAYLKRDDIARIHGGGGLFSGFRGRLDAVSLSELSNAYFVAHTTDGKTAKYKLPRDAFTYDEPLVSIDNFAADLLNDSIDLSGWFRSVNTITSLQLRANGERIHGFVNIREAPDIARKNFFRGPPVYAWQVKAPISSAFQSTETLSKGDHIVITCELQARDQTQATVSTEFDPRTVRSIVNYMTIFDRRNSRLHMRGLLYHRDRGTTVNILVANKELASGIPLAEPGQCSSMVTDTVTDWCIVREVNGIVPPGATVTMQVRSETGDIYSVPQSDLAKCVVVQADSFVNADATEAYTLAVFNALTLRRVAPEPAVLLLYQGTLLNDFGGGPTRAFQLLQFFKRAGFRTILVDRSAPWQFSIRPSRLSALWKCVDIHIPVHNTIKRRLVEMVVASIDDSIATEHERQIKAGLTAALRKGRLLEGESTVIYQRMDSMFSLLAAYAANKLQARLAIGSYVWSAEMVKALPRNVVSAIDTHDLQFRRYKNFAATEKLFGPGSIPDIKRYYAEETEERELLANADFVIAISDSEKRELVKMLGADRVVRASVHAMLDRGARSERVDHRLMFVGNDYLPNVISVSRFIEGQWASIKQQMPTAELHVYGLVCRSLTAPPDGIYLHGVTANLVPHYRAASIVLNPVLFGSGLSVKTIEALSYGKCCLSTPFAAESITEAAAAGAIVVSEFNDFRLKILEFLTNPQQIDAVENAAASYVTEQLDVDVVMSDLLNLIETKLFYN